MVVSAPAPLNGGGKGTSELFDSHWLQAIVLDDHLQGAGGRSGSEPGSRLVKAHRARDVASRAPRESSLKLTSVIVAGKTNRCTRAPLSCRRITTGRLSISSSSRLERLR